MLANTNSGGRTISHHGQQTNHLPRVFLGSSKENIEVARAIQEELGDEAETSVWNQGIFELTESTLRSLIKKASTFDFAVFVFAPEDKLLMRGELFNSTRDNVVFELGLFIGCLGADRTFIVMPSEADLHLPTDLLGMNYATYNAQRRDNDLAAAVGRACSQIRRAMRATGLRQTTQNQERVPTVRAEQQAGSCTAPTQAAIRNSKEQSQVVKQSRGSVQAFVPESSGRTITVGTKQHSSIQAAVRAARSGDTVFVPSGTYNEKILLRKGIWLIGEDRNNTIVCFDGLQGTPLAVPSDATGLVENITFAHLGNHDTSKAFSVITLTRSKVLLRRCKVINGLCYGITCFSGDQARIEECEITGNGSHGIIVYNQGTHPSIINNDIHHNQSGIWFSWEGSGSAENNYCHDNRDNGIVITDDAVQAFKETGVKIMEGTAFG